MSKILVVEDSSTQREMIVNLLKNNQFEISTASNGLEAIAQAQSFHPDLVITDIIMPQMHGYELCRRLRDNPETWNINIVMCSAKSTKADRHWGLRQGANAYVTKPFHPDDLLDTVKELLSSSA
ncbi:response regulator [Pseudanabaena sp. FACHB-1998]|uniref:response regulator transcription factor n=1 Tax=Pseudanabaena sp. FACHB-1998 TaxID=2692858 RepID=UPI001680FA2F|nr:response regulator [Pseudanabaena sp. FACHB-1998]MBD2179061.1 response regulator [Pseudanabaena sp. FACHB-1998]